MVNWNYSSFFEITCRGRKRHLYTYIRDIEEREPKKKIDQEQNLKFTQKEENIYFPIKN